MRINRVSFLTVAFLGVCRAELRTAAAVLGESHPEAFPGSMADRLPCIRDREEGDQEKRNRAVQIAVTHQESGWVQPPMRLRVTDSFSQCYFFEQRWRRFGVVRPRNLLILTVHRFLRFTVGGEINVAYARGYCQK
jgi:hypothetical protein